MKNRLFKPLIAVSLAVIIISILALPGRKNSTVVATVTSHQKVQPNVAVPKEFHFRFDGVKFNTTTNNLN